MKTCKISRCPFCKALIKRVFFAEDRSFGFIKCGKCKACGPIYKENIRDYKLSDPEFAERAIHLWNVGGEQYPPVVNYEIWRILEK